MPNTTPNSGSWRGEIGSAEFPAEPDRYHLYVGWFCPFAARALLARELKGLQDFLPISVVKPYPKGEEGWRFPKDDNEYPGSTVDHLFGSAYLHDVYFRSPPSYKGYQGKYSVPLLWDKKTSQAVNNESEDIMRHLNHAFDEYLPKDSPQREFDLRPDDLVAKIDEINQWLVPNFNSGVYKAGFAQTQEDYEKGCRGTFESLDKIEAILKSHDGPFMLGDRLTEVDIKAYATLIRFDTVYVTHFKVNIGTVRHNYPVTHRYLKNMYWKVKGFREVTDFKHIKENYFKSHMDVNPKSFVPLGPVPDIEEWTTEDEKWRESWRERVKLPG